MTRFLFAAVSAAALMTATSAFAGDLELFGVNSLNGTQTTTGGTKTPAGAMGSSNARTNAIAKIGDINALYTQQVVGANDVTATLNVQNSKPDGKNALTSTTGTSDASKVVNITAKDASATTTTNMLTISNIATNASATFSADSAALGVSPAGTPRAALRNTEFKAGDTPVSGETMVAQQVVAEAKTEATATFADAITSNTSIANMATGASALVDLHR